MKWGVGTRHFRWYLAPGFGAKGAVGMTFFRLSAFGFALVAVTTSLTCAGERDRMKLQQPLVPTPKLYCYSANCMSLSSTVLVSDACWRTCAAQCGGHFQTCVGAAVLNNCRFGGAAQASDVVTTTSARPRVERRKKIMPTAPLRANAGTGITENAWFRVPFDREPSRDASTGVVYHARFPKSFGLFERRQ
jgi:hypothetical protein